MTQFETLKKIIKHEYITGEVGDDNEILNLYHNILTECLSSHYAYRSLAPKIIALEEETGNTFTVYQLSYLTNQIPSVIRQRDYSNPNLSDLDKPFNEEIYNIFFKRFKEKTSLIKGVRLSDFDLDLKGFSENDILGIANVILETIKYHIANNDVMSAETGEALLILSTQLRFLLKKANKSELYYYAIGMYFDKLFKSEFYQSARDLTEEIILCGFDDNHKTLGFLNAFKCYSNQSNRPASLLYANLSLTNILINSENVSEKYLEQFLWQSIKFFRNIDFYILMEKVYILIPSDLDTSPYNKRAIDSSYYAALLKRKALDLPSQLLDYFNKNREDILASGSLEIAPWLIILYQIKRFYPDIDFQSLFGFYLKVFESIVGDSSEVKEIKSIIEGNSESGLQSLKKSIKKLTTSRDYQDVQYDMERAVSTASRIIEDAISKKNVEAILVAMFMKTDFALSFRDSYSPELIRFELPDVEQMTFTSIYENNTALVQTLKSSTKEIIWLMCTEEKMFQMSFSDEEFHFFQLRNWVQEDFHELLRAKAFFDISFEASIKDSWGYRELTAEEYLQEESDLKEKLLFLKINLVEEKKSALLVKDRSIVGYPHNLLLDQTGNFIHKTRPITDILTTEWFIENKDISEFNAYKTKSIWIPTSGGDFTISMLFGKLEKFLRKQEFKIFNDLKINSPIASNINVICMHGADDISSKKVFYPNQSNDYIKEKRDIGEGTILILLVCYSGSYKNEFHKNNVSSLVKNYIQKGYQAVVAPFWALHTDIPPIWLPTFLNALDAGNKVDDAVFKANREVYNKYPTPAAWAAMHLYGNPNVRFKSKNV